MYIANMVWYTRNTITYTRKCYIPNIYYLTLKPHVIAIKIMSLTSFSSIIVSTMYIEIFCSKSYDNSCTLTIEISVVYYHAMYSLQNNIDFKCSFQSPRLMRALRLPKRFCWLL